MPTCAICQKAFTTPQPRQVYCSHQCRLAARQARRRKPPRQCDQCQKAFVPLQATQTCCTRACRLAAKEARRRKPPEPRECIGCGQQFQPRHGGQRRCREKCGYCLPTSPLGPRECVRCGATFQPSNASHKLCKPNCRTPRTCGICFKTFTPTSAGHWLCSQECRKQQHIKRQRVATLPIAVLSRAASALAELRRAANGDVRAAREMLRALAGCTLDIPRDMDVIETVIAEEQARPRRRYSMFNLAEALECAGEPV